MANGRILVIAPEVDMRRSLVFALEAEGYAVTARAELDTVQFSTDPHYDCTVLDQKAVTGSAEEVIDFCERARPVVLLSDGPIAWLSDSIAQVVETPTPGSALSSAIRRAVLLGSDTESP